MARIFFTVFMVDNNILDILLIKCEPWYVSKHARHLRSKITSVKSNNSNVSVNKRTAQKQHSATFWTLYVRRGLSLQYFVEHSRTNKEEITYCFTVHTLQGEDYIQKSLKSTQTHGRPYPSIYVSRVNYHVHSQAAKLHQKERKVARMSCKGGQGGLWRERYFAIGKKNRQGRGGEEGQIRGAVWAVVMNEQLAGDQRMDGTEMVLILSTTGIFLLPIFGFWHVLKEMKKRRDEDSDGKKSSKGKIAVGS